MYTSACTYVQMITGTINMVYVGNDTVRTIINYINYLCNLPHTNWDTNVYGCVNYATIPIE